MIAEPEYNHSRVRSVANDLLQANTIVIDENVGYASNRLSNKLVWQCTSFAAYYSNKDCKTEYHPRTNEWYQSKNKASYISVFREFGLEDQLGDKIRHDSSKMCKTPKQALREFVHQQEWEVTYSCAQEEMRTCEAIVCDKTRVVERSKVVYLANHKNYGEHKAALAVLRNFSANYSSAFALLTALQKDKLYKKTMPSGLEESESVELKGKKHHTGYCSKSWALSTIKEKLGGYWCGWMNQPRVNEASFYMGIHNSGIVQGVRLSSLDKDDIQRCVFNVAQHMSPRDVGMPRVHFYDVIDIDGSCWANREFEICSNDNLSPQTQLRTHGLTEYIRNLQAESAMLKRQIASHKNPC